MLEAKASCLSRRNPVWWFFTVVRVGLAVAFLWAGAVKLSDPSRFADTISHYELVPEWALGLVAVGLPLVEIGVGVGALCNAAWSFWAMAGLLVVFIGVLWFGILKGLAIDCGCFSADELASQESLRQAFYRDWLMLALLGAHLVWNRWKEKNHWVEDMGKELV
ncbi:Methylamine utilisation protein MauE [Desulfacinum hydrothermale DSM 13146]|uniref:Methylamine utilisation protein MauE n=1 Tax=Desulfacinum hydrothermale DSM 13146 TaxID=1121390 RepID=A0A1W1XIX5_9BACT|nr:MauE/DoxX family redox-associated membrane protein [Desulfacinum hydrothermale]SMC23724.1 Methylamine utilisation protein MauE [Desulfacinum hydrothermale DSM 13146]